MTTSTQIGEVHEKLIKKQDEIKNKQDEIIIKKDEIKNNQDEIKKINEKIKKNQDELKKKQDELTIVQNQDEFKNKQDEIKNKQDELKNNQDELTKKQDEIKNKQNEIIIKQDEIKNKEAEIEILKKNLIDEAQKLIKEGTTDCYVLCKKKKYKDDNKDKDGYFFNQGKNGWKYGIGGVGVVVICILGFIMMNSMYPNIISNIIHKFQFTIWNILLLLFIFGIAPFGYLFWMGKCKNEHPGPKNISIDKFLTVIPFIASLILTFYPASLILSSIEYLNLNEKSVLGGICVLFGFGGIDYWISVIKNTLYDKECSSSPGGFAFGLWSWLYFLMFSLFAGLIIVISGVWFLKPLQHRGWSIVGFLRNFLITIGLVLTNLLGGINFYSEIKMTS